VKYYERKSRVGKIICFALRIIKLNRYLIEEKKEFVLSKGIIGFRHAHRQTHKRSGER
jgi:hypothetical protein